VKDDAEKWWPIIMEFGIKAERPRLPVWVTLQTKSELASLPVYWSGPPT
jgi:hypothetical protein